MTAALCDRSVCRSGSIIPDGIAAGCILLAGNISLMKQETGPERATGPEGATDSTTATAAGCILRAGNISVMNMATGPERHNDPRPRLRAAPSGW